MGRFSKPAPAAAAAKGGTATAPPPAAAPAASADEPRTRRRRTTGAPAAEGAPEPTDPERVRQIVEGVDPKAMNNLKPGSIPGIRRDDVTPNGHSSAPADLGPLVEAINKQTNTLADQLTGIFTRLNDVVLTLQNLPTSLCVEDILEGIGVLIGDEGGGGDGGDAAGPGEESMRDNPDFIEWVSEAYASLTEPVTLKEFVKSMMEVAKESNEDVDASDIEAVVKAQGFIGKNIKK